jgi:hypothetical protein
MVEKAWAVRGLLLALVAVGGIACDRSGHERMAKNDATRAMLRDLEMALEVYRQDFNTYPCAPGDALVADTRHFVACLGAKRSDGKPYLTFPESRLVSGECRTVYDKPVHYTFPVKDVPGPDGKVHANVDYYLWTPGGLKPGPAAAWEVNNWEER